MKRKVFMRIAVMLMTATTAVGPLVAVAGQSGSGSGGDPQLEVMRSEVVSLREDLAKVLKTDVDNNLLAPPPRVKALLNSSIFYGKEYARMKSPLDQEKRDNFAARAADELNGFFSNIRTTLPVKLQEMHDFDARIGNTATRCRNSAGSYSKEAGLRSTQFVQLQGKAQQLLTEIPTPLGQDGKPHLTPKQRAKMSELTAAMNGVAFFKQNATKNAESLLKQAEALEAEREGLAGATENGAGMVNLAVLNQAMIAQWSEGKLNGRDTAETLREAEKAIAMMQAASKPFDIPEFHLVLDADGDVPGVVKTADQDDSALYEQFKKLASGAAASPGAVAVKAAK